MIKLETLDAVIHVVGVQNRVPLIEVSDLDSDRTFMASAPGMSTYRAKSLERKRLKVSCMPVGDPGADVVFELKAAEVIKGSTYSAAPKFG